MTSVIFGGIFVVFAMFFGCLVIAAKDVCEISKKYKR